MDLRTELAWRLKRSWDPELTGSIDSIPAPSSLFSAGSELEGRGLMSLLETSELTGRDGPGRRRRRRTNTKG